MALRARRAGGESKPPQAASVKSRGGERCGKGPAGPGQVSDEKTNMCEPLLTHRKTSRRRRNRGSGLVLGTKASGETSSSSVRELPACGPDGVRCKGGVSSSQALAWNRRTCRLDTNGRLKGVMSDPGHQEGEPHVVKATRGRVPMRGTGADRLVVVMKAL